MNQVSNLQTLAERLDRIKDPVLAIQGDADGLVPPGHGVFLKETAPDPPVRVEFWKGTGHLLVWREYERVKQLIVGWVQG